jgi:membrane-associated phospholipid phosphatase
MSHDDTPDFRRLLHLSALGLLACAALVTLCYFFIDRRTAFFVRDHKINQVLLLRWMTYAPMAFNALAPVLVVYAAVRRAWGPLSRAERTLLASAVALMVAIAIEWYLKALFGRYWPGTWVQNNPSLLGTGAYGFHPFHFGEWYGSFPSGHTARAFAPLAVVWTAYPRLLWPGLAVCLSVVVGLVGMDYHFVGDTVGGAYLGWVTGAYTAAFFGLHPPTTPDARTGR